MEDRIHLQILTSGGVRFDGRAHCVLLPLAGGEAGILSGHAPLMGAVEDGVVRCTYADGTHAYIAVGIGVANVVHNEVTLLVRAAETAEEIDVPRAEAAEQRARSRLANRDRFDASRAEASLRRARARQKAAQLAGG